MVIYKGFSGVWLPVSYEQNYFRESQVNEDSTKTTTKKLKMQYGEESRDKLSLRTSALEVS